MVAWEGTVHAVNMGYRGVSPTGCSGYMDFQDVHAVGSKEVVSRELLWLHQDSPLSRDAVAIWEGG